MSIDPEVLKAMGVIRDMEFHGDFVIFGQRKKKRSRRRKTDPYYKVGIAAARRRRTKTRSEKL